MEDVGNVIRPLLLWLAAGFAFATPSPATATGYTLEKVALAGDNVPGTGGAHHANSFFSVALNELGEVAFVNDLTGGVPSWGLFLHGPAEKATLSLAGDTAPGTGSGTYFIPGGFANVNDKGEASFMAVVTGGSASSGIFLDSGGGADLPVIVAGQPAPDTGGGSFDGGLNSLNLHSLNAAGDVVFVDTVSGGTKGGGVFRNSGGVHSSISLEGDSAPGTAGGVYDGFEAPAMNDAGAVVFPAFIVGGSVGRGLFQDAGTGTDSALALAGDTAPGTGSGSFVDFLFPDLNENGEVAFLANVLGGTATGGVFRISGGVVSAVAVENDTAPGTGGGTYAVVTSLAPINEAGDVAFSATLTGGIRDAGVFRFDAATAQVVPVVLFEDIAPDSGGATFAQFGFVDLNDAGQIAFQATLSDENLGLFLASPPLAVPALPPAGIVALATALLGSGWALAARRQSGATSKINAHSSS